MSTDFKGAKRVSNGLKGSLGVLRGPKKLLLTFEPLSKHFHVGDHLSCNSHQHLLVLPFCNKSSNEFCLECRISTSIQINFLFESEA